MNLFKKAATLCTALLVCLGASALSACNLNDLDNPKESVSASESATESSSSNVESSSESTSEEDSSSSEDDLPEVTEYAYKISLQNATGATFPNCTVRLKSGDTLLIAKKTNRSGYAIFTEDEIPLGAYTIEIDPPKGYVYTEANKTYSTSTQAGQDIIIPITPTGVLPIPEEGMPMNLSYALGDIMYDFTIQTSDNTVYTLSEVLEQKDMVLLNFWATWCGPCQAEFPAMTGAYSLRRDEVSILAISTTDNKSAVASYKSSKGISFDMAHGQAGLTNMFNTSAIPLSVVIDRYGVVAYMHTGNMTAVEDFTNLFDYFTGDDYQPTILTSYGQEGGETPPDGTTPDLIEPNVDAPNPSDVKKVFAPGTDFSFTWVTDSTSEEEAKYSWPWTIENGEYLDASNKEIHSSYAQLFGTFTAKAGDVLCFEYKVNTEEKYDVFYVIIDGVIAQQISGYKSNWTTCYAYVFDEHLAGEHEIAFIYNRDGEGGSLEGVQIRNLHFQNINDLQNVEMDYVFHQGGEVKNNAGAATQFKYYVTPVLNETDGYYHVGSEDGPILLANMMNVSAWSSTTSIWLLAYNDYVVMDGFNYKTMIEQYAWEANNNLTNYGYTPVTEELKFLLDIVAKSVSVYKNWDGQYHENEWLEMCVYFAHYGTKEAFEDPMKTITFKAAEELHLGRNTVNVTFAMTPRGFKYKFIPTESGVYNFYSTETLDPTTGKPMETITDPECWLVQLDGVGNEIFLGHYTDLVYATSNKDGSINGHVNFYYPLEAGQTYYLLCTTFLDTVSTYDIVIQKTNQTSYMENAAAGPYSFNEITGELFLPDAIDFAYSDPEQGGDGYYHYVDRQGNMGSIIYLDLYRPTAYFGASLYQTAYDACFLINIYRDRFIYISSDKKVYDENGALLKMKTDSEDGCVLDTTKHLFTDKDGKQFTYQTDGSTVTETMKDGTTATKYFLYEGGTKATRLLTPAPVDMNKVNFASYPADAYWKYLYAPEKRAFYVDGKDYSEIILEYCFITPENNPNNIALKKLLDLPQTVFDDSTTLIGVNQDIYNMLMSILGSSKFEGILNDWLRLCYYEKILVS